jgi:hypothetical protein
MQCRDGREMIDRCGAPALGLAAISRRGVVS